MSAPWNLHRLYSLDPSSPGFFRRLHSLFRYDEEERYLISLQGSELVRLLDFLDRVCTLLSAFRPATKQALQTLGATPSSDDIFIQCLHKLQAVCGHHAALPSSYFTFGEIVRTGDHPIVVGGISDVWEGTYRNKTVSIEHLKIPLNDDRARKKVRVWYGKPLLRVSSKGLQSFVKQAVMWKRLKHPNIIPFVGITTSPFQIISKWMPNGTLMDFVEGNPDANRISLVSRFPPGFRGR